ncbi:hypothetical protein T11_11393, partial [Trichinella zimbabwensis]
LNGIKVYETTVLSVSALMHYFSCRCTSFQFYIIPNG